MEAENHINQTKVTKNNNMVTVNYTSLLKTPKVYPLKYVCNKFSK